MSLGSLKLSNFRCFDRHEIQFSRLNVVVGHNNAGKSTVAEALRIASVVTERFRNIASYRPPPDWLAVPKALIGFPVSLENLEINFEAMFHRYGDPPSMIEASFGGAGCLRIYVGGPRRVHCVLFDGRGKVVVGRERARRSRISRILTLPQVGPVAAEEKILTSDYVRASLSSRLAPIHFRNQINLLFDLFPRFQSEVENTWPGLQVPELIGQGEQAGERLHLQVRDGDFVAEVSLMGHGLQMWLQTMWFLTRAEADDTLVLDEPDVYMHADLQRRLIRHVRERYAQVIITSHSTEIMSEVSHDSVIVIDRKHPQSRAASSLPAVQRVVAALGSVHNVHLARLWASKRFLLVEGKDARFLKAFQNAMYPNSTHPLDAIPNAALGGWGNWRHALGSSLVLQNAAGKDITTYCILDSDYYPSQVLEKRRADFAARGVSLHIWLQKEIENYLLVPSAIVRTIASRLPARMEKGPTKAEVEAFLSEAAERQRDQWLDAAAQEIFNDDRSLGVGGANKAAKTFLDDRIRAVGMVGCVSGKELLGDLSAWAHNEFGVTLGGLALAESMEPAEIGAEVRSVLASIEKGEPFEENGQR